MILVLIMQLIHMFMLIKLVIFSVILSKLVQISRLNQLAKRML